MQAQQSQQSRKPSILLIPTIALLLCGCQKATPPKEDAPQVTHESPVRAPESYSKFDLNRNDRLDPDEIPGYELHLAKLKEKIQEDLRGLDQDKSENIIFEEPPHRWVVEPPPLKSEERATPLPQKHSIPAPTLRELQEPVQRIEWIAPEASPEPSPAGN
jgi:hypothetical protein